MQPPEEALFRLPAVPVLKLPAPPTRNPWLRQQWQSQRCEACPARHALPLTAATAIVGAATGSLLVGPAARMLRHGPVLRFAMAAGAAGRTGCLARSRGCGGRHRCCSRHSGGHAAFCVQEGVAGSAAGGGGVPGVGRASLHGCQAGTWQGALGDAAGTVAGMLRCAHRRGKEGAGGQGQWVMQM